MYLCVHVSLVYTNMTLLLTFKSNQATMFAGDEESRLVTTSQAIPNQVLWGEWNGKNYNLPRINILFRWYSENWKNFEKGENYRYYELQKWSGQNLGRQDFVQRGLLWRACRLLRWRSVGSHRRRFPEASGHGRHNQNAFRGREEDRNETGERCWNIHRSVTTTGSEAHLNKRSQQTKRDLVKSRFSLLYT